MSDKKISTTNIFAKECIVSALLQLTDIKPLSSVTISELCKKAGVSRMTFYRNYASVEDIFTKRLEEIFQQYKKESAASNTGIFYDRTHMIHYFSYLSQYQNFLKGLIQCGFGAYFLQMLSSYISEEWQSHADELTLTAFSGSLYNMFRLWASLNYRIPVETLAEKLETLYRGCEKISVPLNFT